MENKLKILVIGSGGREHALVWKLAQSPRVEKIYAAPGNGGICSLAQCVPIPAGDIKALLRFAKAECIDLAVVGPEGPLVAGIVDLFRKSRLAIFGPSRKAALLEGSKVFAKRIMKKYGIPTAGFRVFTQAAKAKAFARKAAYPLVIKADGLAAGKGVVVAANFTEAKSAIADIMTKRIHGAAGKRLLIEEFLKGQEVSVMALTDGKNVAVLPPAQDHKRIFDQDQGPNTGGMGAYSPTPVLDQAMLARVRAEILEPVVRAMRREGRIFRGVLYAGLMLTQAGPQVLEFNVRFGDPETQAVLPRLGGDLLETLLACTQGRLRENEISVLENVVVCVVLASQGYPGAYQKGEPILGLEQAQKIPGVTVFHAGTTRDNGTVKTSGGRVLGVTALGQNLQEAVSRAYQAADLVRFTGAHFRRDIAQRALMQNI